MSDDLHTHHTMHLCSMPATSTYSTSSYTRFKAWFQKVSPFNRVSTPSSDAEPGPRGGKPRFSGQIPRNTILFPVDNH